MGNPFLNYQVVIERAIVWSSRQNYCDLIESFLRQEIKGETFRSNFMELRTEDLFKINEICDSIEKGSKLIPDFNYTSKSVEFTDTMTNIFYDLDLFDPTVSDSETSDSGYSENKLRSSVKEDYQKLSI